MYTANLNVTYLKYIESRSEYVLQHYIGTYRTQIIDANNWEVKTTIAAITTKIIQAEVISSTQMAILTTEYFNVLDLNNDFKVEPYSASVLAFKAFRHNGEDYLILA